MADLIGLSLGRYHILKKLGEGGMATVYKAYDTRLERDIAIKVIRRGAFPPEQFERILMRFEQEARLIAKLSHPNIVKLLDYGVYEGSPYHVLEYIPGGTLKKLLERRVGKQMPWRESARLLLPIAQALEYAHEHKIIHRDIKPSNILLTEKGQPILSDFGIAKPLDIEETHTLTGAGVGIGTAAYMSPEQGLGKKIDGRTDIYSLGIVYYELITGRTPFSADTPQAVIDKQIHDPLPRPTQYVTDLPEKVEHLLLKALAKAPENRYPEMGAFGKALEALLSYPTQVVELIQDTKKTAEQFTEETTQDDLELDSDGTTIPESVLTPKSWLKWLLVTGVIAFLCMALAASGGYLIWRNATPAAASLAPFTDSPTPTETAYSIAQSPITDTPTPTASFTPIPSPTALTGIGSTQISPKDGMVLVYVPEGEFLMGSADSDMMANSDEKPQHRVSLDAYWIDRTEVTNAMYTLCVQAEACQPPNDNSSNAHTNYYGNTQYANFPVIYVDWNDAKTYCEWSGRRLPTEAEWEKAARGMDGRIFPWGNDSPSSNLLNYNEYIDDTTAVGSYSSGASPYGVLDMAGNVYEWVNDWYSETYYSQTPSSNPTGPGGGQSRVLRGGSWVDRVSDVRSAIRYRGEPVFAYAGLGFRCVLSP
jgi:serine/threonine-protein kinase